MAIIGSAMEIAFWSIVIPTAIMFLMRMFGDFFYGIGAMFFEVMDMLQSVFRKLAGLGTVWVDGKETGDILSTIMKSNIVIDVLVSVSVFALALVILGSIVQMIRLEYTTEGSKNSKDKIFATALKSLLMFILIPLVCFVGIRLSNYLLQAVDYATSSSGASTVSGSLFTASTNSASKVLDKTKIGKGWNIDDLLGSMFKTDDYSNAIVEKSGDDYVIKHFEKEFKVSANDEKTARTKLTKMVSEKLIVAKQNDQGVFEVGTALPESAHNGTRLESWDTLNYKNVDAVGYFYHTGSVNYLLLYVGCYICLKALFSAAMGMIARIYKVVGLFVISPAVIGLQPLDDGNAYKSWRKSFMQNVLSCYGFIVALNLYFMVVGVLQTVELWNGIQYYLLNSFMQFLFVLTGATMIKDLSGMFANLIGASDAMADGEKVSGEVGKMAGSVAKIGVGAAMGGAAAFKGLGAAMAKRMPTGIQKGDDGKYHLKKSVLGEEKSMKKGQKADEALEKAGFKRGADGNYDMTGMNAEQKALVEQSNAGKASAIRMRTDKKLAERSAVATKMSISAGQDKNRFKSMATSMLGTGGLLKGINNITGGAMDYISGKAYKGDDTSYQEAVQKQLKKAGMDEKTIENVMPSAGSSFLQSVGKKGDDALKERRTKNILATSTASTMHVTHQSEVKNAEDAHKEFKEGIKAENEGYRKEIAEHDSEISKKDARQGELTRSKEMKNVTSRGKHYKDVSTDRAEEFLSKAKEFGTGKLSGAEMDSAMSTFQNVITYGGYRGNSEAQKLLDEISAIRNNAGSEDEARRLLASNASVNISSADLKANLQDGANNTRTFGKYKERLAAKEEFDKLAEEKSSLNEARREKQQKINENNRSVTESEQSLNKLKAGDIDAYARDKTAIEQALKNANEKLVEALNKLNQKSEQKDLKVKFATDQKFKIVDEPILAALKKIQEAADAANAKKEAGKQTDLLSKMLEEMKKKK